MKNKNKQISIKWKILTPVMIVAVLVCATLGVVLGARMSDTTTELAA